MGTDCSIDCRPDSFPDGENSPDFEGMIGLSGEVVKKKIASEEEAWSGQTLLIFDNNWSGILGQAVESAVADAKACLSEYVSDGDAGEKVYADYGDMPVSGSPGADRECVVEKCYAVMQALVDLAKGLNVFDDCNPFHHGRSLTYRHQAGHPGGPVFDPAAPEGDAGNDGD